MIRYPLISIAHPTARPAEALKTRDLWLQAAKNAAVIEYVLCVDFGETAIGPQEAKPARIVYNYGTKCSVNATNTAAQSTTGEVIVVVSDDFLPSPEWDIALRKIPELWAERETVLRCATGGTADARGLLTIQILNRRRFERIGYLFHPGYVSMYADDDFTAHAVQDRVIVDAPHLLFRHEHWTTGEREIDAVYRRQNAPERYEYGEALFRYRRARMFAPEMPPHLMGLRNRLAA